MEGRLLAGLTLSLAMAAAAPATATKAELCSIGRAAFADLPLINHAPKSERFYGGRSDQYHRDLLEVCPSLRRHLSGGLRLANDSAFQRERDIVGKDPVTIFRVDVPRLDADHRRAVVRMGYTCNGLCGAEFEVTYVRMRTGWKQEDAPRLVSVS